MTKKNVKEDVSYCLYLSLLPQSSREYGGYFGNNRLSLKDYFHSSSSSSSMIKRDLDLDARGARL